jgi:hypoxanthine phosphoribosyltransferase
MKLNTQKNLIILITIVILSSYHFLIQNGVKKSFVQTYFKDYNITKRPICSNHNFYTKLYCTGMPSGHAETISVFSFLLYFYSFIPLWICLLLVTIISIQRIITNKHTLSQVIIGSLLGLGYAMIYSRLNISFYSFLITFSIGLFLVFLSFYKIDKKVYEEIPWWVDKQMIPNIKKKQDSPLYIKICSFYLNAIIQSITFISWEELEKYLDIIVNRIKKSGVRYDAVVGIKTGGAIISDYISIKLGLPNYKIKLTRSEYNCNKKPSDTVDDIVKKTVSYNESEFKVCEGIDDNLEGKNIILIDETVATGKTMEEAYKYLKNNKRVNVIYPTCIAFYKRIYNSPLKIYPVINETISIWPWGYDN